MKRILVGTDFSFAAGKATIRSIRIAAHYGASLRFVHATDSAAPNDILTVERRLHADASAFAGQVGEWRPEVTSRVSAQRPAEAILHEADAWYADLIIIGAHGVPRFRDVLFGTTGTHIVRHGTRPVLIVGNDPFEDYSRVLIAVGEPEAADHILGSAVALSPDAEMLAVHAFYPPVWDALAGAEHLKRERTRIQIEMERRLGSARKRQSGGQVTAESHAVVEDGDALGVLMDKADALEPNLIAMGTRHGATYIGSHAVDTMFWTNTDLLIVPQREHALA